MSERQHPVSRPESAGLGRRDRREVSGCHAQQSQIVLRVGRHQLCWQRAPVWQGSLEAPVLDDMGIRDDQPIRLPHRASTPNAPAIVQLHQAQAYPLDNGCHGIVHLL
jgi:hypothetical protein